MTASAAGRNVRRSRRIYGLLGAIATVLAIGIGPAIAPASATDVLEQNWESGVLGTWSVEAGESGEAHNFWHVENEPQKDLIKVPDINPNLVALATGDSGHLPSAYEGTHVAWFGQPGTGTFCGDDFLEFGNLENGIPSLNGCESSAVQDGYLISPSFSLEGAESAIMHFFSWWEIEAVDADRYDLMSVEYSSDGGVEWHAAGLLNPADNPAGAHYQPYSNTGLQTSPDWKEYLVDLSPAIGSKTVKVRFHFDTEDDLYNGFRGWLIDNVRVATPFDVPPPAITSVDTCSGTTVVPVSVIHGTNFLLGSTVSLDGGEALTAQTPSSDRIEIPVIPTGAHTLQVIDPNGTIKSNVFNVTQPADCSPALPPTPPIVNLTTKTTIVPPLTKPPVETKKATGNTKTGEIEGEYEFPEPGSADDTGEVSEGASLASVTAGLFNRLGQPPAVAAKKCKKGFVRKHGKCVNNKPVLFGRTHLNVTRAGRYKLRLKPSKKVLAALKKGKTLNVKTTLVFTPAGTVTHLRHVVTVKVHLKPKHKHKH